MLIVVDPTVAPPNQVNPKTCQVKKGTSITWREQHNTPFKLVFDKNPGNGNQKIFNSADVNGVQEVTITAKNVSSQKKRYYEAYVGTTKLDPTVIIDP